MHPHFTRDRHPLTTHEQRLLQCISSLRWPCTAPPPPLPPPHLTLPACCPSLIASRLISLDQRRTLTPPASCLQPLLSPCEHATTSAMPRPPASTSPSPPPTLFPYEFTANLDFPHLSTPPSIVPTGSHSSTAGPATVPAHIARRSARPTRRTSLHRLFAPPHENDSFTRRPVTPNLAPNPGRPRATPSERYLRRSQARIREQRSADMDATLDLPDSIPDIPIHNPFTISNVRPRTRSPTVQVSSERRHKRRKLDHNAPMVPEYVCFKYGHKGQVVPGRLRMEIVSCDGGEHLKDNPPGLYKIQNVLRNDKSVYCSESSSCNLLLKHIGEAPFALEKVVIRAPDRGFTAPYVVLHLLMSITNTKAVSKKV